MSFVWETEYNYSDSGCTNLTALVGAETTVTACPSTFPLACTYEPTINEYSTATCAASEPVNNGLTLSQSIFKSKEFAYIQIFLDSACSSPGLFISIPYVDGSCFSTSTGSFQISTSSFTVYNSPNCAGTSASGPIDECVQQVKVEVFNSANSPSTSPTDSTTAKSSSFSNTPAVFLGGLAVGLTALAFV
ncbi:hypothetical protein HK100_006377 [Physocladia obscura]|uniref:Uncharacterized protein n=1 Tax=Physocladia obscura TaxID=109957 RepID=A0AAD5XBD6_9FUNG|nr:hypothetical protein HK100_006377 [Physocladia obscura]